MQIINVTQGIVLIENILPNNAEELQSQIMSDAGFNSKSRSGRKMCRMTEPGMRYTIFGKSYTRKNYSDSVLQIRERIETALGIQKDYFNTCTLNYYHNGKSGFRNHTDRMPDLEEPMIVATLTLGESNREMTLTHIRSKKQAIVRLPHNSLIFMGPGIQNHWVHGIPATKQDTLPRLSLSFRRQKITNVNIF